MDDIDCPCGIATEIEPGDPVAAPIRSIIVARGCGVANVNVRPAPAPSKPVGTGAGEGWTGSRVCASTDGVVVLVAGWGHITSEYAPPPRTLFSVVLVIGDEELTNFPLTISQSQSAIPPGTASTAVCGEYTLIPSWARRRRDFCCGSWRVRDLRPRKIMGSVSFSIVDEG